MIYQRNCILNNCRTKGIDGMGEPAAKIAMPVKSVKGVKPGDLRDYILSRRTPEMVIAFCGAVGSGVSTVTTEFKNLMEASPYGYRVERIKVSDLIVKAEKSQEKLAKLPALFREASPRATKTAKLQDLGDALRQEFSYDILAQLVISDIASKRVTGGHISEAGREKLLKGEEPREEVRTVWLVDSFKHPDEVKTLRCVYGSMFYLVGVLCPVNTRAARLKRKGMTDGEVGVILERDTSEPFDYGQKLIDTIHMSDFFINNGRENLDPIRTSIQRYIAILFGKLVTPTLEEYAMYVAQSAAYNSGCLSRQVGAAIMAGDGCIISYGYNDVPKCGGGLYCSSDSPDNRCYNTVDKCRSESEKDSIKEKIKGVLTAAGLKKEEKIQDVITTTALKSEDIEALLSKLYKVSGIKNLTEFSKAVHAEMDAIIKVARKAIGGLEGCKMFVTTYPCHNCAKHIVAAGIGSVVYIEPYEKSLAIKLHDDSITSDPDAGEGKVKFIPFDGVAPRQFQNFFVIHGERKDETVKVPSNKILPISEKFR